VVVDDDPAMRTLLISTLRQFAADYDLLAVPDGAAALALVAQRAVALVITDYTMPEMDGVALIGALTALAPPCPVALLTGDPTPAIRSRAQGAGAVFAVTKPFRLEQLVALVQTALAAPARSAPIPTVAPGDQRAAAGGNLLASSCLPATIPVADQRILEDPWPICS